MKKLTILKISLAVGMALSIIVGCVQAGMQNRLSAKLVRLHVLANSDSEYDQALKLKVRDAVLECRVPLHPTAWDLDAVRRAAVKCLRDNGSDYGVRVTYTNMYFDTRDYDGFSLPAGYYDAVRVVIGAGEGHNWWCVIYPALCTSFAEAEAEGTLTGDELSYIKRDGEEYIIKFKLQEAISHLANEIF